MHPPPPSCDKQPYEDTCIGSADKNRVPLKGLDYKGYYKGLVWEP